MIQRHNTIDAVTKKEKLKTLGQRIASARQVKGMTLESLAYGMGLSKGNLSEIERGLVDPRYTTLQAISAGLDLKISDLLRGL